MHTAFHSWFPRFTGIGLNVDPNGIWTLNLIFWKFSWWNDV